jgi:hypothetical protein
MCHPNLIREQAQQSIITHETKLAFASHAPRLARTSCQNQSSSNQSNFSKSTQCGPSARLLLPAPVPYNHRTHHVREQTPRKPRKPVFSFCIPLTKRRFTRSHFIGQTVVVASAHDLSGCPLSRARPPDRRSHASTLPACALGMPGVCSLIHTLSTLNNL